MMGLHEKVLSYCNQNDIEAIYIQGDTEVKQEMKIKSKKDLKKIKIKGCGGTTLQPIIDRAVEKYNKYPMVLLTDGYTDNLDFSKVKDKVLIISCGTMVPVIGSKKVRQIIVDREDL
jgi:predicted metal-dependent peptidase